MRAVVIPENQVLPIVAVDVDPASIEDVVGKVAQVYETETGWLLHCHKTEAIPSVPEEVNLPAGLNVRATGLLSETITNPTFVLGDALITGSDDGTPVALPADQLRFAPLAPL